MKYIAVLVIALILTLACEMGPTNTPSPPPTPMPVGVLIGSFEANELLARDEFEGQQVQVTGVQGSVGETRTGYYIILESGLYGNYGYVRCETEDFPLTDRGTGLLAWGKVSAESPQDIILKDCGTFHYPNVFSWVLFATGSYPTAQEISMACATLREAGFDKVANDHNLTDSELQGILRVMRDAYTLDRDEILYAAEGIVEYEGANAERWCRDWS